MRRWYSLGLVKQKPFASSPQDSISFGDGRAIINPRSRDVQEAAASPENASVITGLDSGEQVLELNYGAQVTPWLLLRPDLQYYIEPGAFLASKGAASAGPTVIGL